MEERTPDEFNIHEAKTHLSRIIDQVTAEGNEIIIKRSGEPVAKVIPYPTKVHREGRGSLAGVIELAEDWDSRAVNEGIAADFGLGS